MSPTGRDFGWYDFALLERLKNDGYHGGIFDGGVPYETGDNLYGGRFAPWNTGDEAYGGAFADMGGYHHIYMLKSQSINTNDVTITGVSVSVKSESDNGKELIMYGEEGYVLELSDNPLIQRDTVQDVLNHVGQKVTGNTFRPLKVTTQSDPSMEAGDLFVITDRKQRSYWSVITNTTFSLSGTQKIECGAETPTEKNYTRYGAVTKLMAMTKDQTDQQLSAYDVAAKHFASLMARSMGLYETYETQEDGSLIKYQHDKPLMADSKTIWKQAIDAFGVSTDGGKTWNAGTDANGNAIYNVLSVIGILAEWINTRGLVAKDNDGNITFEVDADTGRVNIVADTFSLSGKTIDAIAQGKADEAQKNAQVQAAKLLENFINAVYDPKIANIQSQIDGQIETWYYDHEPTLSNSPASAWKTEADRAKHEGDLFYWKSKGYSYRFFKDGNTWKWQIITDSDITKALTDASKAQDTADNKRRVFVSTPAPPYDVGDLWFAGSGSDIMTCMTARASGSYISSDWQKRNKYIDQTDANNAASAAVGNQTQEDIFNKLTNNGKIQGIYLQGGKIYINGDYIKTGTIVADIIKGGLLAIGGETDGITLSGNTLSFLMDGEEYGRIKPFSGTRSTPGVNITSDYGAVLFRINSSSRGQPRLTYSVMEIMSYQSHLDRYGETNYYPIRMGLNGTDVYVGNDLRVVGSVNANRAIITEGLGVEGRISNSGAYSYSNGTTAVYSGNYIRKSSSSSARYKDILRSMNYSDIEKIYNISPVIAKYKDGYLGEGDSRIGAYFPMFIAEDVHEFFPDAVDYNEDGEIENWNYRIMIPAMFQMIKSQKETIDMLTKRMDRLEAHLLKGGV